MEETQQKQNPNKIIVNFIMNDLKGILNKKKLSIENCPIAPEVIGFLARLVSENYLDKKQMKKLVTKWVEDAENDNSRISEN